MKSGAKRPNPKNQNLKIRNQNAKKERRFRRSKIKCFIVLTARFAGFYVRRAFYQTRIKAFKHKFRFSYKALRFA